MLFLQPVLHTVSCHKCAYQRWDIENSFGPWLKLKNSQSVNIFFYRKLTCGYVPSVFVDAH